MRVHLCSDRIDLINSIADLKLGNKRLQEMNRALQVQMEGSEEHLRELQTENQQLKQDIKEYVVSLLTKWFIPNLHNTGTTEAFFSWSGQIFGR